MLKLINLAERRSKECAATLRELADLADKGLIEGALFVCKFGPGDHRAGSTGAYKRNTAEALQATFLIERLVSGPQRFADSGK
jgi:hypothetical protein